MKNEMNTTTTATTPILSGFRIWFDNCGSEPHFSEEVEDDWEWLDAYRPWTAEDDRELKAWEEFTNSTTSAKARSWGIKDGGTAAKLAAIVAANPPPCGTARWGKRAVKAARKSKRAFDRLTKLAHGDEHTAYCLCRNY